VLRFRVDAGRSNYLALVFEDGAVRVFVNGKRRAAGALPRLLIRADTLPDTLGDWVGCDHLFVRGPLEEVRAWRAALSGVDLRASARHVRGKLARRPAPHARPR
jgi:hypothetical protein